MHEFIFIHLYSLKKKDIYYGRVKVLLRFFCYRLKESFPPLLFPLPFPCVSLMPSINSRDSASRGKKQSTKPFSTSSGSVAGGEQETNSGSKEMSSASIRGKTSPVSFAFSSSSWTLEGKPASLPRKRPRKEDLFEKDRKCSAAPSSRIAPSSSVFPVWKREEGRVPTVRKDGRKEKKWSPRSQNREEKEEEEEERGRKVFSISSSVPPPPSLSPRAARRLRTAIQASPCLPSPDPPLCSLPLSLFSLETDAEKRENNHMHSPKRREAEPPPTLRCPSVYSCRRLEPKVEEEKQHRSKDAVAFEGEGMEHKNERERKQENGEKEKECCASVLSDRREFTLPVQQEKLVSTLSSALHAVYLISMTEKAQRGSYSSAYRRSSPSGSGSGEMRVSSPPLASVRVNGRWLDGVSQLLHGVPLTMDDLARLAQLFPQWLRIQWSRAPSPFYSPPSFSSSLSLENSSSLSLSSSSSSSPPPLLQARLYLTADHVVSMEEAATSLRERIHHTAMDSHEEEKRRRAEEQPLEKHRSDMAHKAVAQVGTATEKAEKEVKKKEIESIIEHITTKEGESAHRFSREKEYRGMTENRRQEQLPSMPPTPMEESSPHPLHGVVTAYQAFLSQQQERAQPRASNGSRREGHMVDASLDVVGTPEGPTMRSALSRSPKTGEATPVPPLLDPTILSPTHPPVGSCASSSAGIHETRGAANKALLHRPFPPPVSFSSTDCAAVSFTKEEECLLSSGLSLELRQSLSKEKLSQVLHQLRKEQSGEVQRKYKEICDRRVWEDLLRVYSKIRSMMGRKRRVPAEPGRTAGPAALSLLSRRTAPSLFGIPKTHMSLAQIMIQLQAERDPDGRGGEYCRVREALQRRDARDPTQVSRESGPEHADREANGEMEHILKVMDELVRIPSSGLRLQAIAVGTEEETEAPRQGAASLRRVSVAIPPCGISVGSTSSRDPEDTKNMPQPPPNASSIDPPESIFQKEVSTSPGVSFSLAELPPEEWHHVILFLDPRLACVKDLVAAVEPV